MSCSDISVQILGDASDILVYVKQAQDAATQSATSAAAAAASATDADNTLTQVKSSATAAAGSATAAAGSATSAAQYMNEAEDAKTATEALVVQAANSADQAAQSAKAASDSADQAAQSAIDAGDVVTSVTNLKNDAVAAANEAKQSATQSADSATQSAGSATQSALSATASQNSSVSSENFKDESLLYAKQSENSAKQSENSAAQSKQYADEAEGYKIETDNFVTQASQSAVSAANSAAGAHIDRLAAEAAATRAENAPVRLKVSEDGVMLNETTSEFNFTGAGVTVKQPGNNKSIFTVEIPGHPPVAVGDVVGLQAALDAKESHLGNPTADYMVLASKTDGTRYWIAQTSPSGSGIKAGGVSGQQYPITDIQLGKGLGYTYNNGVITIVCEIASTELDALTARVNAIYAPTQAEWHTAFDSAIDQYVKRLTAVETQSAHNDTEIVALQSEVTGILADIHSLQGSKVDKVESKVNPASRTITLTFKSGQQVIDTDLIDISAMFATNPPADQHAIWFGFTTAKPPTESQIKAGTTEQDHVIIGHDITLTRADATPAYMYVWIPDVLGAITGFSFAHAFTAVWQSYPVTVGGAVGKVYVSDNQTASKSVSFEVQ